MLISFRSIEDGDESNCRLCVLYHEDVFYDSPL